MTGQCFICGRYGPLEEHHVYRGPFRKKADKYGYTVHLCHFCHNEPPDGVHYNRKNDLLLKSIFQHRAMDENGWSKEDFIREFGRSYID